MLDSVSKCYRLTFGIDGVGGVVYCEFFSVVLGEFMICIVTEMRYILTVSNRQTGSIIISTRMAPLLNGDSHTIGLKTATQDY